MRNVILHIGLPRCGSTTIQILLAEASTYPGCPLAYPAFSRDDALSDYGHNAAVLRSGEDDPGRFLDAFLDPRLLQEVALASETTPVVISAEDLWRCDPTHIRSSLERFALADRCIVAYAIRPYLSWIASLYRSNVGKTVHGSYSHWLAKVALEISTLRNSGRHSLFDLRGLAAWQDAFGQCRRLSFPPTEPLVELAGIAGVEFVPKEWRGFTLVSNVSQSEERHPGPPDLSESVGDMAKNLLQQFELSGLADLFECTSETTQHLERLILQLG